jgi:hypothetical protein
MRSLRAAAWAAVVAAAASAAPLQGQVADRGAAFLLFPPGGAELGSFEPERTASPQGAPGLDLTPTFQSLLLPGLGQHTLGQKRKWLYAGLEAVGWVVYLDRRSAGSDYRDRYRDWAWNEGRIQSGPRIDGDFEYYETLSKWTRSGAYDADAGRDGIQPESDPATYNGSIWALAERIYLPGGGPVPETDPAYQDALGYYQARAYDMAFLWDWSPTPGGKEEMTRLIEASDDRFRQATTTLGLVIANHVISAADAYLASRGRALPVKLSMVPLAQRDGATWSAVLTIPAGP